MSKELPVILITNGVLLPDARLKVPIRSKINLNTVDRFVITKNSKFTKSLVLVAYRYEEHKEKKVFPIGTVALVEQVVCWQYGSQLQYTLHLLGVSRAKIDQFDVPLSTVSDAEHVKGRIESAAKVKLLQFCKKLSGQLDFENAETANELHILMNSEALGTLSDFAISHIPKVAPYATLLEYLGVAEVPQRIDFANEILGNYFQKLKDDALTLDVDDLNPKKSTVSGSGMKRIETKADSPIEELFARIENTVPEQIKERVKGDMQRMKGMNSNNHEYHVLHNYLELVAALPWNVSTEDVVEIGKARQLLEDSHQGMKDVKRRVLEFLAVRNMTAKPGGPILCFSGPPGIGKTSIAKAIAESLGRKFERISLGGIRDESDIRGHRRTYVAAMPGRIIQALKRAGTNNPVILLDEVDKLFVGVHGSPSAALLEVLDPEQNFSFADHYLNLPFDLSNVLFIATANDISNINGPLLDRMELIEMSGYSTAEKILIAERHLTGRQMVKNGMIPEYLEFTGDGIRRIVESYTREAGVRQLERAIGAVCRHAALRISEAWNWDCTADVVQEIGLPIVVDEELVETVLGPAKFSRVDLLANPNLFRPGVCFGLAWTPFGGELMLIETSQSEGKGTLLMTGKLGDVLRESVEVASSWLRSNARRLHFEIPSDRDLHVHLPAGAVEKDGPSAGCALVSALFSLYSNRIVRKDTAVTGEISLTGQVMPVGGIKEKILGAHRSGIRRVVLPESNEKDVEELEADVKNEMTIEFVSTVDDLLDKMMDKQMAVAQVFSKL